MKKFLIHMLGGFVISDLPLDIQVDLKQRESSKYWNQYWENERLKELAKQKTL